MSNNTLTEKQKEEIREATMELREWIRSLVFRNWEYAAVLEWMEETQERMMPI